jgi:hypothetical protein
MAHRLDVNLNDELTLLGYNLPTRRVEPGQTIELDLFWKLQRVVQGDYIIFTHLVNSDRNRQGSLDRRLQEGYPVAFWYPGEIVRDERQITVEHEATSGLAWLRIGGYELIDDQQIRPLPFLLPGGKSALTNLPIGPIMIGKPSQTVERSDFGPQVPLAIKLGEPPVIRLRGYDWNEENRAVKLVFYWESLTPTPVDWTTFVHIRSEAGEIVGQKDGQTGGNLFPTSLWQDGEIIADPVSLTVPFGQELGEYIIVVGLYRLDTGQRLTIPASDDNSLQLMTIKLGE